jgi:hypothetical protein
MHAFTLLAKRADPELYGMMMAAAGLDAAALQRADPKTVEKAYEKLAYDLERYVKKGELPEGAGEETRGLFEKLKAFLRDIARIIVEDIAPETKALFDGLFGEEGPGGAQTGAEGKRHGGGAIDARRGPCDAIWGK